jgi:8-oxo-dGTP pyrophosphatase MutT (NUDIX family)
VTEAADAVTVCLVRAAHHGPEVLMVQRPESAAFMGGAWVFPGGAVDDSDAEQEGMWPLQAAALRELVEETGIWLLADGEQVTDRRPAGPAVFAEAPGAFGADRLRYFANWITPAPLPIRFDTRFFVTEVSRRVEALVDGKELVDAAWLDPADALERADAGDWLIAFPTRQALIALSGHGSVAALMESLPDPSMVEGVQPRIDVDENAVRILLPTDPGFEDAAAAEADPDLLARAQAVAAAGGDVPAEMRTT